jgi:hypothetical protein
MTSVAPATRLTEQSGLRVCLLLDRSRAFRWHGWLIESLATIPGCAIQWCFGPETRPLPSGCELLCQLERLVYGLRTNAIDAFDVRAKIPPVSEAGAAGRFDVIVDLAGMGCPLSCGRVITPFFNGIAGEIGIIAAFLRKERLTLEIHDSANPAASPMARPTPADADILGLTLDAALSCAARLIGKTVRRSSIGAPPQWPRPITKALTTVVTVSAGLRLAHVLSRKLARLLDGLARGGKRWTVGWRVVDHQRTLLQQRSANFAALPDDGRRYYADPFPFHRDGRSFIFLEEFSFATGRGCIAVSELHDGQPGTPQIVLEEAHHLSYPFVFAHEDTVWMIPEAGESGRISLYRAVDFPYKWALEAVLIEGIEGYDATLLRHGNRFWLFVCERVWQSSSWDILSLFHSQLLIGKWAPHEHNPVLCDGVLSRPAGATFARGGRIVRPVQDCSERYGGSIKLCSLDELDQATFRQTVLGRIHCDASGCHTYNYATGLEVIDAFGRARHDDSIAAKFAPAF